MIDHISIRNFAIIENTEIDFGSGLNVITGETGSGKSIVVTAISLVLGARADTSFVRHGCEKALIELSGELDGKELALSREISAQGRSLCRVNGRIATLAELQDTCLRLADIHGQYDNQSLLDQERHIDIVDRYGSGRIRPVKTAYREAYASYIAKARELRQLTAAARDSLRRADFNRFEVAEIDKARLVPGEDEALADRVSVLKNREKIYSATAEALQALNGDSGALSSLGRAAQSLEGISSYSSEYASMSSELTELLYSLQDMEQRISASSEELSFSSGELDSSIERIDLIDKLKGKYGNSIEEILAYRDRTARQLSFVENFDSEKARLEAAAREARSRLKEKASLLSSARRIIADELRSKIQKELADLNFPDARLAIEMRAPETATENGADIVEFLISTNRGEPLKPLAKTASGGEISRVMLAIKAVTSAYDDIDTLIFDEIDAGISGRTASVVGRKLREIASGRQVICITHLPQIAAMADTNLRIYKDSDESATYTHVERLTEEARIEELARLLGGDTITETTRRNAAELIAAAKR